MNMFMIILSDPVEVEEEGGEASTPSPSPTGGGEEVENPPTELPEETGLPEEQPEELEEEEQTTPSPNYTQLIEQISDTTERLESTLYGVMLILAFVAGFILILELIRSTRL